MVIRKLEIDLDQLAHAMDASQRQSTRFYLDKETGNILAIGQTRGEGVSSAAPWLVVDVELIAKIQSDSGARYEPISERDEHEAYHIMEDFIDTIRDPRIREKFEHALAARNVFRRFKDVLAGYPKARDKWRIFEQEHKRQWAREFLEELEIETTWQPPMTSAEFGALP